MTKKILTVICASAMILAACTSCGNSKKKNDDTPKTTTAPADKDKAEDESTPDKQTPNSDVAFEDKTIAGSGDAILAITDGQWYVQYWGAEEDILSYDAEIAHIDKDGDYTVGVNVDTQGAKFTVTGDANSDYSCSGVSFACIKVLDGTKLYPNMSIEIKEIRVDGEPVELKAKNYTSSDDNVEMRANIINTFVKHFPDDAHTAEGALTGEFGDYSSVILDEAAVASWKKIEVDFTVTGVSSDGAAAEEKTEAESSEEESSQEESAEEESSEEESSEE
ncbi:MAG: hypothetical protein MJ071_01125 [Oscillospiraceae bacterium]|nr:hypothetical protein [Oscillospiraceae bacterium]